MMETKFTPGPWRVEADPCHFDTLSTVIGGAQNPERDYLRDQMQTEVGGWADVPEQEANARLIAAAPDLYAALQALYDATGDCEGGPLGNACMNARKALSRARGETP